MLQLDKKKALRFKNSSWLWTGGTQETTLLASFVAARFCRFPRHTNVLVGQAEQYATESSPYAVNYPGRLAISCPRGQRLFDGRSSKHVKCAANGNFHMIPQGCQGYFFILVGLSGPPCRFLAANRFCLSCIWQLNAFLLSGALQGTPDG